MHKALIVSREKTLPLANRIKNSPYDSPTKAALEKHRVIYEAIMACDEELAKQKMMEDNLTCTNDNTTNI